MNDQFAYTSGYHAPAFWADPKVQNWKHLMGSFTPSEGLTNYFVTEGTSNVLRPTFKAPKLIVQPNLPIQIGQSGTTTYTFDIQNVSNLASANNSFIYFQPLSGMTDVAVYAMPANTPIAKTGDIYRIGAIAALTTQQYKVVVNYTKCTYDSLKITTGWNCQGYPNANLIANYPCQDLLDSSAKHLYVVPQGASLQSKVITEPTAPVDMCADVPYEFEVKNVQFGFVFLQKCTLQLPVGYTIKPGTSFVRFPASGPYVTVSNPVQISGNKYVWNVAPYLLPGGSLHGTDDPDSSLLRLKFEVSSFCDPQFISGKRILFTTNGVTSCGQKAKTIAKATLPSIISGSSFPYDAVLTMPRKNDVIACGEENTLYVRFLNLGSKNTGAVDSVYITIPTGMSYVPNSTNPIHNVSNPAPAQDFYAGLPRLKWRIDQNIVPFDSAFWSFRVTADPSVLSCDTQFIQLESVVSDSVTCITTGTTCYIKSATGTNIENFYISKPILTLSNFTGSANCSPGVGEQVNFSVDVTNTGPPVTAGTPVTVGFYRDINGNGIFDRTVDSLIISGSFSTGLGTNQIQNVTANSTIPIPGLGCAVIAVIDNQGLYGNCACDVNELLLRRIPLVIAGADTTVCSGQPVALGTGCVIPGYTYSWSPATGLSSTNTANTVLTRTNTTGVVQTYKYFLQINRAGGCTTVDTVVVTMNPDPMPTATPAASEVCNGGNVLINLTSNVTGAVISWTGSNGTSGTGNIVNNGVVNAGTTPLTLKYYFSATANGCSSTMDSISIVVLPTPSVSGITVAPATTVCTGTNVTLTPAGPVAGTTFTWTATNGTSGTGPVNQFVYNNGTNPITITYTFNPSTTSGTGLVCSGTAVTQDIVVNPKPVLTVTPATLSVCSGAPIAATVGCNLSGCTTYWYRPGNATNTGNISDNVVNLGTTPITINYRVWSASSGCTSDTTIVPVVVSPNPTLSILGGTDSVCTGGAVSIPFSSDVPGTVFVWTGSNGSSGSSSPITDNPVNNGASPLNVTYTLSGSFNGCAATNNSLTKVVKVKPSPNINLTPATQTTCSGAAIAPINITSSIPGTTYSWSGTDGTSGTGNPITGSPINNTGSPLVVIYSVTPTASGCAGTVVNAIDTVNPKPTASAGPDVVVCGGSAVAIGGSPTATGGMGAYSYNWSPSTALSSSTVSNPMANPVANTTYVVQVTTPNGCFSTDTVQVTVAPKPAVTINASKTSINSCGGDTSVLTSNVTGVSLPVTYQWILNGSVVGTGSSYVVKNLTPGNYIYQLVVEKAGCYSDTATQPITVAPNPVQAVATVASSPVCTGGNVQFDVTPSGGVGPYTYVWSGPNTFSSAIKNPTRNTVVVADSGLYTVLVADANLCLATATVNLIVNPTPVITVASGQFQSSCSGDPITIALSVSPTSALISWTGSNGTAGTGTTISDAPTNGGLTPTIVTYTINAALTGCNATTVIAKDTVKPRPTITVTNNATSICSGTNSNIAVNAQPVGTVINWWINGSTASTSGTGTPIAIPMTNSGMLPDVDTFYITSSLNGCGQSDTVKVLVTVKPQPVVTTSSFINPSTCSGTEGSITLATLLPSTSYTLSYTKNSNPQTSSITTDASGNLVLSGLSAGNYATLVVTLDGCSSTAVGPFVLVDPTPPTLSVLPTTRASCSGDPITFAITATPGGGSVRWSGSNGTSGTGLTISDAPTNGTTAPIIVIYTVTDTLNNCAATPVTVSDTVKPLPTLSINNSKPTICSADLTNININAVIAGTSISWWLNGTTGTGSGTAVNSTTITIPLTNNAAVADNDTFYVTSSVNGCTQLDTTKIIVTVNPKPVVDAGPNDTVCLGVSQAIGGAPTATGTSPFTYNWAPNGMLDFTNVANPIFTPTLAGTYTYKVTVTDGTTTQCSNYDSIILFVPTQIALSGVVTNVTCNGLANGSVDLTVNGGTTPYSYLWSNGATTQDINAVVAGTYTVTVTSPATNCSATATFTITQPNVLATSAKVKTDVSCFGQCNGSVNVTVSGGTAPYNFAWNNGGSGNSLSGLCAGTYILTVTDSKGCTYNDTSIITQPSLLQTTLTGVNVTCKDDCNGQINTSVVGGTQPYTYLWSDGSTLKNRNGICADAYALTVTDKNNCTVEALITITEPDLLEATGTATNVACNGANNGSIDVTVVGGTTPYVYAWNNGATTQDLSGLAAGTYKLTVTDAHNCDDTISFVITEPTLLSVSASKTDVTCKGANNGTISLTVTGGVSPYTYTWSDGPTTKNRSALSPGTYTVTVKDLNNCTIATTLTITEPALALDAAGVITNVDCSVPNTGSIDLTVVGGTSPYSFNWSNGQTTEDLTALTAGTYDVTVRDAKLCQVVKSFTVTAPAAPLAVSHTTTPAACNGGTNGSITLTVTGGTPAYSFNWSNGATTQSLSGLAAGVYVVTVADNAGCSKKDTVIVNENSTMNVSGTVTNVSCAGASNGAISQTVTGGTSPYVHKWNDGATTKDRTGLAPGTYTDTIRDFNNCKYITQYTITQPNALTCNITKTDAKCYGSADGIAVLTVNGGTPVFTYTWSNGATSKDLTGLAAGTYNVTVKDANNCTSSCTVVIGQPDSLNLGAVVTGIKCFGGNDGAINLTVSGGVTAYSFAWSNSATTEDITALVKGNYNVVVTDANGCVKSANYVITEPTELKLSSSIRDVSCFGGADGGVTLSVTGGTPPVTFAWSNGQTTQNLLNVVAGTYTVTAKDANNCSTTLTVTVKQPAAALTATVTTQTNVLCQGDSTGAINVTIAGGTPTYIYAWSGPNGFTSNNEDISGLTSGLYKLTVTDQNNCTAVRNVTITQPSTGITLSEVVTKPSCNGGTNGAVNLTVSGGSAPYTYAWTSTNGFTATTEDISGLSADVYTVVVTDAVGCKKTKSINVNENTNLTASLVKVDVSCFGSANGKVRAVAAGGVGPYTYNFGSGFTSVDSITGLTPGTYTVTVKDANACVAVASASIAQPDSLNTIASISDVKCFGGNDGNIITSTSGGTPVYSYVWQDGPTTSTRSNLTAGTYTVQVIDAKGCSKSTAFVVTQPAAIKDSLVVTNVSCAGGNNGAITQIVSGGTPGYSFVWSDGNTSQNRTGLVAALYKVTVSDSKGCAITQQVAITQPDSIKITLKADTAKCATNANVVATVTGGVTPYTYTWSNGATTPGLTGVVAGTYTLTVRDANNCTVSKAVTVINLCPPVIVDVNDTTPEDVPVVVCPPTSDFNGDKLTLTIINCATGATTITTSQGGTAEVTSPDSCIVFTPKKDYFGQDTFCVVACDPSGLCDTGKVIITILPVNDPPVADTVEYTEQAGTPHSVNLLSNVSDPNGDPVTITVGAVPPGSGLTYVVTGNGAVTITGTIPGTYTIPYYVCDLSPYTVNVLCDTSVIIVHILDPADTLINHAPVANNDQATTTGTTPVTINVKGNDSDPDGDNLTIPTLIPGSQNPNSPDNGTFSVNADGTVKFVPNAGLTPGIYYDTITYTICDTLAAHNPKPLCDTAKIVVTTNVIDVPSNRPPLSTDDYTTTPEDQPVVIQVKANDNDPDGDSLTFPTVITTPKNGTTTVNTDGTVTYTPNPNFFGKDSFQYTICDTLAAHNPKPLCDTAWAFITIAPRNEPPVADTVEYTEQAGTPHSVNLLSNVSDPNGDPVTITVGTPSDTSITYTVTGNGAIVVTGTTPGTYTIPYYVCDSSPYTVHVLCDTSVIIVHILDANDTLINHAPVANNDQATTTGTTPVTINVKGNDSDPDGDNLTMPTLIAGTQNPNSPDNGTFSVNPDGTVKFTPNAGLTPGIYYDTITYVICDTLAAHNPQPLCDTAKIVVTTNVIDVPSNRPPLATDDYTTTHENVPVVIQVKANDSDADGDSLTTPKVITTPTNGTATVNANGTVTYTPNPGYRGADSFQYVICDTLAAHNPQPLCDTAWAHIFISNDPPVAMDDTATLCEDSYANVNVLANDSDPNNDKLVVTIVKPATHGTSSVVAVTQTIAYAPTPNFFGKDTVTYQICDNGTYPQYTLCDTAILVLTVNNVNDAPFAINDTLSVKYQTSGCQNVLINDNDPDGDSLFITISTPPANGSATINGSTICYTPANGFVGTDTVYYQVCDVKNPALTYCNNTFASICDVGKLTIYVGPSNNPPVIDTLRTSTPKNTPVAVNVGTVTSDPDGNPYTITYGPVTNGTWTPTGSGTGIFTPAPGFTGTATVVTYVCDSSPFPVHVLCDTAVIIINVVDTANNLINHPPVANNDYAVTPKGNPVVINVKANDSDPDGDGLTKPVIISGSTTPNGGTVTVNPNGSVTYVPAPGFVGKDSFQYVICDTLAAHNPKPLCDTAWGFVFVTDTNPNPVNHAPVATDDFASTPKDVNVTVPILANDSDPDGDSLTTPKVIGLVGGNTTPNGGVVTINPNGTLTYDPAPNFIGKDTIKYVICDTLAANLPRPLCDTATVVITVGPNLQNNPPVADTVRTSTPLNTPVAVNVASSTSDPDGNPTTISYIPGTLPNPSTEGTWTPTGNGTGVFTPASGFTGTVIFPYVVCDQSAYPITVLCDTSYVIITVTDTTPSFDTVNHAPIANNDYASTPKNNPVVMNIRGNDTDPDGDGLTLPTIQTIPANGTVKVNANGTVTYTPNPGFTGKDSFKYVICDTLAAHNPEPLCTTAWAYVFITDTLTNVNHPPVATDDFSTTDDKTPVTINVKGNDSDPDGDSLTVPVITDAPNHGTAVVNPDGTVTYTPTPGYTGKDTLTYVICDTLAADNPKPLCDTATVIITVTPSQYNNPPVADPIVTSTPLNTPVAINVGSATSDPDGNPTTISYIPGTLPNPSTQGTWTPTGNGTGVFTPATGFTGTVTFPYVVCDLSIYPVNVLCDTSFITIIVTDTTPSFDTVNHAPIANNDLVSTPKGNPTVINVKGNDSDPDGDGLTKPVILGGTTTPNGGTVTVNPDGTVTYKPTATFTGKDSFQYVICDTLAAHNPKPLCDTAWVFVFVTPDSTLNVNHPPVATDDFSTTDDKTPVTINVKGNDSDPDGDSLTVPVITDAPNHGTAVVNPDGTVTYTPTPGYTGKDTLTYVICDTLAADNPKPLCDTATVIITVTPSQYNNPPVADPIVTSTPLNTPVAINVGSATSDPDGNPTTISYIPGTLPNPSTQGTWTPTGNGTGVFTPATGFTGTVTFPYVVCDLSIYPVNVLCDTSFITIIVTDTTPSFDTVNHAPIANNDLVSTPKGNPTVINVKGNDSDPDGDGLTKPVILGGTTTPNGGTVTVNPDGTVTYKPTATFTGKDSFQYVICDTLAAHNPKPLCDTAWVFVFVTPDSTLNVNHPPVATDDFASTPEDSSVVINVKGNDSDPDGDSLTVPVITDAPNHGTAVVNPDGTVTYTPNPNYNGKDTLTYVICDTLAADNPKPLCDTATVIITVVNKDNDPIVANPDTATTPANTPVTIGILGNDKDPENQIDTAGITIPDSTNHGTITVNPNGTITYTPDPGYVGKDTLIYQICDKGMPVTCDTAIVIITVTPPMNNPPVADTLRYTTPLNTPVAVNVGSATSDPDGNPLTYSYGTSSNPSAGTWTPTGASGTGVFTPTTGFTGTVTIPYYVCDASPYPVQVLCDTSVIIITIVDTTNNDVNHAPIANNDYATTPKNDPIVINVKGNDSDPDGDALNTPSILTPAANGTAVVNPNGSVTYTPVSGFVGKDSFQYVVCDTLAAHNPQPLCDTAWAFIFVTGDTATQQNHPPVATDDFASTPQDSSVVIKPLSNDSDPDGDSLTTPVIYDQPNHGTAVVNPDGTIKYTPAPGYTGKDTLVYVICDTLSALTPSPLCDTATVIITIGAEKFNNPPVADTVRYTTPKDVPVAVNVGGATSDPDGNPLTYSYPSTVKPGGQFIPTGGGTGIFIPTPGFTGTETFPYIVCDTSQYPVHVLCDTSVIIITVIDTAGSNVNHAPVANNDYAVTPKNNPVVINVRGNDSDPDGDGLTTPVILGGSTTPNGGTVTVNPNGTVTYVPAPGFVGKDSFQYVICDTLAMHNPKPLCDTAWGFVFITNDTVVSVNHAPVATDDFVSTPKDDTLVINVRGNDSDPDGDNLTIPTIVTPPSHGSANVNPDGTVTYVPTPGYVGTDTFTYVICDTLAAQLPRPLCDTATVHITITPKNSPPTIEDTTVTIPELTTDTICPVASDPNLGDVLNYQIVNCSPLTSVTVTSINPTSGCFVYNTSDVTKADTNKVCVVVCDDGNPVLCDTAVITIIVTPTPSCPVAMDDYVADTAATSVVIAELGNDNVVHTVGTGLTVTIVDNANNGTGVLNANGTITYTPTLGFSGIDSITYLVCDTVEGCCDTGLVQVYVGNIPFAPVALNDFDTLCEESIKFVNVRANDFDANGDQLAVTIITPASNGLSVVSAADSTILYVPNTNFFGTDSVVYSVCDLSSRCDTATLYLTVLNRNDVPVAIDDTATVLEDNSVIVNVSGNDTDIDGDFLTVSLLSQPNNGSIVLSGNNIKYTPKKDFCGVDSFAYRICGGEGTATCPGMDPCDLGLVFINVQCVNDTPIAPPVYDSIPEDSFIVICPPVSDVDGDDLIVIPFACTSLHGTLTPRTPSDSCFIYTPDTNWNGIDTICYVVCDTNAAYSPKPLCDTSFVIIKVTPLNEPPIANNIYTGTQVNTPVPVNVASSTTDPNGDPLTYSYPSGNGPSNGTWTSTGNGTGVYTPNAGYTGVDSFKYVVCDNSPYPVHVLCDTAWVFITIIDGKVDTMNHAPIANDDYGVTNTTTPIVVSVKANDFDVDGDDLTLPVIIGTPSLGGTVTVNSDGTVTYDPTGGTFPDAINVVTFQYVICDTLAAHPVQPLCDTATVHIIINKVDSPTLDTNNPPVATDDFDSTTYGVPVVVVVKTNDSDPDGDSITVTSVTQPNDGTVTINPDGSITYVPDFGPGKGPNANDPDTFTYVICDNGIPVLCDTATVVIFVPNSVQATNDTTLTGVNQPVVINVKANDWDPELDSFSVIQILGNGGDGTSNVPTLYGNATINANGTITYVPNGSQCNVTDTFRYIVRDTLGAVDTATVYVFVDCCSKPVAVDDNVVMSQGDTLYAHVITNDIYKSTYPQHVNISVQPTHGTVTVVNDTTVMYIPNANYCGTDYLEYILSDTCGTDTANLSITVDCNCKAPVAVNNYGYTTPGTLIGLNVVTNDTLFNTTSPHFVSVVSGPSNGTVTVSGDSVRYTPNTGFIGNDTMRYRLCIVCAGDTLCAEAAVMINVDSVCKAPIAKDDTVDAGYVCSRPKAILINDLNVLGATVTIVKNPTYGTATVSASGDTLTYRPSGSNPNVKDTVWYALTNVCGLSDTAALYINVSHYPCNSHHPLAADDSAKLCLTTGTVITVPVLANDFDQDGDQIRVTYVTTPSNGTAQIVNGAIVYTVTTPNFTGKDTFAYTVCDNGTPNLCRDARVIVTVDSCKNNNPVLLPPVVYDTTYVDSAIVICINAPDPDGDTVSITSVCDPINGTISNINGLCFTYTPNPGYVGDDTFCIVVCDNGIPSACDTGLVIVTVIPFDTTQFVDAVNDVVFTPGNTPITIDVDANDNFGPKPGDGFTGDTIFVTQVFPADSGTVVINPDGTVTYTPNTGFCGVDSFQYVLSDNGRPAQFDTATVIVYVCDTPQIIAVDDTASTPQGNPTVINVLNNDIIPANNGVTVTVNCDPNHGTVTVNTDGTITYNPLADYFGKDTFCYIVCANIGGNTWICDTAIVVITIPGTQPCFFPNAFSPNGDGVDESFQFPCNYDYPNSVLKVYNRWGDEVWRNENGGYRNNWDGKNLSGADLPDGTYYYVYQYNDGTNRSEAKFVVIQR